ncbi:hypothetical protein E2C01_066055 [Portunus trituberculatus]|uniref:Uncharacterized protein n=1 Tax=Portunus trituberculatus TaxID=210409 RepID=A0A5B7HPZ3_PORTR|nr:hypothetical protein [Portunus trituberculatus]
MYPTNILLYIVPVPHFTTVPHLIPVSHHILHWYRATPYLIPVPRQCHATLHTRRAINYS